MNYAPHCALPDIVNIKNLLNNNHEFFHLVENIKIKVLHSNIELL